MGRIEHGKLWDRCSSDTINTEMKKSISMCRKQLDEGKVGDLRTTQMLHSHTALLQWVSMPITNLKAEASKHIVEADLNNSDPKKYLDICASKLKEQNSTTNVLYARFIQTLDSFCIDTAVQSLGEIPDDLNEAV